MGVTIVRLSDGEKEKRPMHKLAERTYVNRDSTKVVPEGSPDAAYLLGGAGDEISDETAKRLGLATDVPQANDYGAMKVAELRTLASERGVSVDSEARKPELVAALEEADQAAPAPGEPAEPVETGATPEA